MGRDRHQNGDTRAAVFVMTATTITAFPARLTLIGRIRLLILAAIVKRVIVQRQGRAVKGLENGVHVSFVKV